jgi:hypothetical protein
MSSSAQPVTETLDGQALHGDELLVVDGLQKYFPIRRGIIFQKQIAAVKAARGVTVTVNRKRNGGRRQASRAAASRRWRAAS